MTWVDLVRIFSRLTEQLRESAFYRAEKEEDGSSRMVGMSVVGNSTSNRSDSNCSNNGKSDSKSDGKFDGKSESKSDSNSDLSSQYEALLQVFNEEDDDEEDDDDDEQVNESGNGVGDINNANQHYPGPSASPIATTATPPSLTTTTITMTRDVPLTQPPVTTPQHTAVPLPNPQSVLRPQSIIHPQSVLHPQSVIRPPGANSHYGSSKISSFFSHAGSSLSHMLGDPPKWSSTYILPFEPINILKVIVVDN